MFNLNFSLPLLNNPEAKWLGFGEWDSVVGTIFAIPAVIIFLSAFIPQYKFIYKTKNTSGIDRNMFMLHSFNTFCFSAGAFFLLFFAVGKRQDYLLAFQAILFGSLNVIAFLGNSYILINKLKNVKKAKEKGMSECDYCALLAK